MRNRGKLPGSQLGQVGSTAIESPSLRGKQGCLCLEYSPRLLRSLFKVGSAAFTATSENRVPHVVPEADRRPMEYKAHRTVGPVQGVFLTVTR